MALLSVDGLSVAYGSQPALEQVSFNLAPGEILGVVGGSGSGKSTLLLAIAPPAHGKCAHHRWSHCLSGSGAE